MKTEDSTNRVFSDEPETSHFVNERLGEVYEYLSLEDLDGEDWVDCIGFDGIYLVSNFGRIKSLERWRATYGGRGYIQKEKIRRLAADNSCIQVTLFCEGKKQNFMVSRLVFFSFNRHLKYLPEYFVIHKDNDWKNNRLENLRIGTQKEVGELTFQHGKIDHLKMGNPMSKYKTENGVYIDGKITELKCVKCCKTKPIRLFYDGSNECRKCCSNRSYYKKYGIERKQGFEIKATEIETGIVTIYRNCKDPELLKKISSTTAIKHARSGTLIEPKPQSKNNFRPFKLEFVLDTEAY